MVNGRISPRSYRRYRLTSFFWKRVLNHLDFAGMISAVDARRLKDIGMDSAKIKVLGNAKYDGLASMVSPASAGRNFPPLQRARQMKDFLSREARIRARMK